MKNKQSLNAVHFRMSSGFLVILRASVNITVAQVSADVRVRLYAWPIIPYIGQLINENPYLKASMQHSVTAVTQGTYTAMVNPLLIQVDRWSLFCDRPYS